MGLVMLIHQIVETDILWPEREARFKEREMLEKCQCVLNFIQTPKRIIAPVLCSTALLRQIEPFVASSITWERVFLTTCNATFSCFAAICLEQCFARH